MPFESDKIVGRLSAAARASVLRQLAPGESPGAKSRRKYRNEPTYVDGIRFDSKKEAGRYEDLVLLMKAGDVRWFARQGRFVLPGGAEYISDFIVAWADGSTTVEDVKGGKGTKTKTYRLKKRQVEAMYDVEIKEI